MRIHSTGGTHVTWDIPGTSFKLSCPPPAQNFTGRGQLDQRKTPGELGHHAHTSRLRVAYLMAMLGRTGESGMTAFTQIRQQFGAFHLAMILSGMCGACCCFVILIFA